MKFANAQATVYNDTVVRQFAIMTVVWGVVGMLVGVIIAAQLTWPELNFGIPWLVIRALSDLAGREAHFDFAAFVDEVAAGSAAILRKLLPALSARP
jgi:cytochrome c oxidase cbb3-type subunit 1